MYYVYIIRGKNKAINKYYIGSTWNLEERLEKHKSWAIKTISWIRNFELVWHFECDNKKTARKFEMKIKKSKDTEKWIWKEWFIKS